MPNDVSYFKVPGDSNTYAFNDADAESGLAAETTRAEAAEQANANAITAETNRATTAEQANASAIAALSRKLFPGETQTLTAVKDSYEASHLLQFDGKYLNKTNFPGSSFLVILHGSATSNRAAMFMVALDSNGQASATIAESISGAMSVNFNSAGTAYIMTSSSTGYTVYATMIEVR